MLIRILSVWSLIFCFGRAAFEIEIVAPAAIACGGIISLNSTGSNPAAIVGSKGGFCSLNYSNLYGIKNLQSWNATVLITTNLKNGYASRLNVLGNDIYQEKLLGFSYGRQFSNLIAAGATVNYYDLTISGFPRSGAIGLNFGAKFFPDTTLRFALLFENVNAPKICRGKEILPQTFAFGWQWQILKRAELSGEIFKDTHRPFIMRSGVRIRVVRGCNLLTGVQFNHDRFSGGLELTWRKMQLALAVQHHPTLPLTFYYGCGFQF
jgi:hypothetical protein